MTIFGRKDMLFFIPRATLFSEVLATDILEDGEAEGAEQKVPGLVLLFYKTAGCQAESVADRASQEQHIQLWQWPLTTSVSQWRLRKRKKGK